MTKPAVGYAGMTHLGLCSAIGASSKGFTMTCFDQDAALIGRLEAGKLPVVEPGLDDMLRDNRSRVSFTADAGKLKDCDLVYVAPDVPTDDTGASDIAGLDKLLELVLANTRPEAVVVVLSQVSPGYTRARQTPGRLLYYQVETLVFGRAVERATLPERFIVGVPEPGKPLPDALETFLKGFDCPDPADAFRKRRAHQDFDQLLPGGIGDRRQYARRAMRAHRCRLVGDRASTQARPAHRRLFLPFAGPGAGRRQSRARPRDRHSVLGGIRNRRRPHQGFRRQQQVPQGLGAAHFA